MPSYDFDKLREFQGKLVRIATTEGEIIAAKVLSVDEEHQDVVLEVLSTNQPERYERLGKRHLEAGWVMPFEYILHIDFEEKQGG